MCVTQISLLDTQILYICTIYEVPLFYIIVLSYSILVLSRMLVLFAYILCFSVGIKNLPLQNIKI